MSSTPSAHSRSLFRSKGTTQGHVGAAVEGKDLCLEPDGAQSLAVLRVVLRIEAGALNILGKHCPYTTAPSFLLVT